MIRVLKWGCGGLVGLFVLLMIIGVLAGGNETKAPGPAAAVQPVAAKTAQATSTEPTPTPGPALIPQPTITSIPSPTASPTNVPSPTQKFTETPLPSPTAPVFIEAKVMRVIDGDTIEVDIQGQKYTVRYIGVNTPETVDPRRTVEFYGKEASAKNKELVEAKTVRMEKDVSETDRYGRLLRYVYVGNTMINAEFVRLGYAQASAYPPDVKYQDRFRQLEREAREAGRGLWGPVDEATPVKVLPAAPTVTPKPEATAVPVPPKATPSPPSQDASESYPCKPGQIKGNRNSMIYHAPGQRDYAKTQANVQCFDTEAEASAAGYRKALR